MGNFFCCVDGATNNCPPVLIVIIDESPSPQKSPQKNNTPKQTIPPSFSTNKSNKTNRTDDDTIVYRWAAKRNDDPREFKNLTPRPSDNDGISFSLTSKKTAGNAVTTLGMLRKAGFICIVSGTHVSVIPAGGNEALRDWQKSYNTANESPHPYTLVLYSITW